jgi:hypothetical protein
VTDGGARGKWVTFGVLVALLGVVVLVVALAGGRGSGGRLVLERMQAAGGGSELLASVPREVNEPSVARGKSVVLECTDADGKRVLRNRQPWPFIEEEGYPLPHAHQPATENQLRRIARCRVLGTSEKLEGELSLRG